MSATGYQSLAEPVRRVFDRVLEFLPSLLGAVVLVIIGWLLARLLAVFARRISTYGLRRLGGTPSFDADLENKARYRTLPGVVSRLVFWIVLLFFIAAGIEALGLQAVSDLFGGTTEYLPRVLLATLIVFAGILLGDLVRRWVIEATARNGIAHGDTIGRWGQVAVMVLAIVIAVDQLGIDSAMLLITLAIFTGSVFGATALAFALGAGPAVANMIAAHYVHSTYRVGQTVRIGEHEGAIVEITRMAVVLETPRGRVQVPARRFNDEVSVLVSGGG